MRYRKMAMTPLGVNYLHTCNPWVAVWWSVALPGLGHFYLGANLKGLLFMALEILFNCLSNLNLAIYHTLLGESALARQVLVLKWALFYPAVYLLSFWDAYRLAVEINWLTRLERQEGRRFFRYQHLCMWGHAILTKRSPWVAWFWSALVFGAGHIYNGQTLKAVILMGWQIALIGLSSLSEGIYLTLLGQPEAAAQALNFQWLLFVPSIYLFNMWDAYHDCVEQNKLADEARWEWLRRQKGAKDGMQTVVGVLLTPADLERAVMALRRRGFTPEAIRWGRLERQGRPPEPRGLREWLALGGALGDTFRRADGVSLMDGATAGATVASLLGMVYGSVLPIGPIGGSVFGLLLGGYVGWRLDLWIRKGRSRRDETEELHQLGCIVQVRCTSEERVRAARAALQEGDAVLLCVLG